MYELQEVLEITSAHSLHQLEVGFQRAFELRLTEDGAVGNITHEKFYNYQELHRGLVESNRYCTCGSLPCGAGEMLVCICIRELNRTDAAKVVHIPGNLVIRGRRWECSLADKKIGLLNVCSRG